MANKCKWCQLNRMEPKDAAEILGAAGAVWAITLPSGRVLYMAGTAGDDVDEITDVHVVIAAANRAFSQ